MSCRLIPERSESLESSSRSLFDRDYINLKAVAYKRVWISKNEVVTSL